MRVIRDSLTLLLFVATVAGAQDPAGPGGRGRRGGGQRGDSMGMANARRAIEKRIREQVRPTEDQMARLREIDNRFEGRRTQLNREEMDVRRELRQAMQDTSIANQTQLEQLVNRTIAFPGRRAALMEEEQKALAQVLSPLQRARYLAVQENLRRLIEGRGGQPAGRPPQSAAPLATKRPPL
jgi:hypothetical protein